MEIGKNSEEPQFEIYELCVWNVTVSLIKDMSEATGSDDESEKKDDLLESDNPILGRDSQVRSQQASSARTPSSTDRRSSSRRAQSAEIRISSSPGHANGRMSEGETKTRSEGFIGRLTKRSSYLSQMIERFQSRKEENEQPAAIEEGNDEGEGPQEDVETGAVRSDFDEESDVSLSFESDRESIISQLGVNTADMTLAKDGALVQPGQWRKRVIEEERLRKEKKQLDATQSKKMIKKVVKPHKTVKKMNKEKKRDKKVNGDVLIYLSTYLLSDVGDRSTRCQSSSRSLQKIPFSLTRKCTMSSRSTTSKLHQCSPLGLYFLT